MTLHTVGTINGVLAGVNTITKLRFMEVVNTVQERQALAVAIRDRWLADWKTGCAAAMNWQSIVITRHGDENDSPYQLAINVVGGGSTLGVFQACIQYNLQTGQAGRRGRGKLYLPGIQTGAMSGGKLASATKVSIDAMLPTLRGRWLAGGSEAYHLGVFSRLNNAMYAVVDISYNEVFACLRSRKLGVGI